MNTDLLAIVQKIKKITGECPGKKQLQKMVYLIQARGISLEYEYGIHFYGPYSEALNRDLLSLYMNGAVDFNQESLAHKISPSSDIPAEMTLAPERVNIVDSVLYSYKDMSPSKLELITTAHFVAMNVKSTAQGILAGVIKIKGDKYSVSQINDAINHLESNDLLLTSHN